MRRLEVIAAVTILLFAVLACRQSGGSKPVYAPTTSAATPQTSPLDAEAIAAVKELWDQHTTKCGEDYIGSENFRGIITLHQYKNVSFVARRTGPTTEADRLNGILWNGKVNINVSQYRDQYEGVWAAWKQYSATMFDVGATKRASGWSVTQLLSITDLQRVKCDSPQ